MIRHVMDNFSYIAAIFFINIDVRWTFVTVKSTKKQANSWRGVWLKKQDGVQKRSF